MGFLDWLFGKKEEAAPPGAQASQAMAATKEKAAPTAAPQASEPRPAAKETAGPKTTAETLKPSSEAENLRRWRDSGQPRTWVESRRGQWDHAAWLGLLEELKRSPYWPMPPEEIGKVLEAIKQEWLQRN
jgi:hypothetical protein